MRGRGPSSEKPTEGYPFWAAGLASTAAPDSVERGEPVDAYRLLEQVVALPVNIWRYPWDPPHVRHLGPMAPDWWKAFGVGDDDQTICCADTNGVALVAIQALHRQRTEIRQEVASLRQELARLKSAT